MSFWQQSEQIAMRACPNKSQNELLLTHLIDQQPVRLDVTFPHSFVVASQRMVTIFGRKWFTICKYGNDVSQKLRIASSLEGTFVVLLELADRRC